MKLEVWIEGNIGATGPEMPVGILERLDRKAMRLTYAQSALRQISIALPLRDAHPDLRFSGWPTLS